MDYHRLYIDDRWTDGWTDRWTDGQTLLDFKSLLRLKNVDMPMNLSYISLRSVCSPRYVAGGILSKKQYL